MHLSARLDDKATRAAAGPLEASALLCAANKRFPIFSLFLAPRLVLFFMGFYLVGALLFFD